MTMIYTPKQEKALQEDRAKDAVIEQQVGRKPISPEERDRIWKTIQDAAQRLAEPYVVYGSKW